MSGTGPFSDFDLNFAEGAQAEEWVRDLCGDPTIEVKAPKLFLKPDPKYGRQLAFIEYRARSGSGTWSDSGITTTKATHWAIKFGDLPGALIVETGWLRRACRLAYERGQRVANEREPNPTKGVLVGLDELWQTREVDS
jgi:hypothetical protein